VATLKRLSVAMLRRLSVLRRLFVAALL